MKIVGGAIPKEYIPAIDAGIQDAMYNGVFRQSQMSYKAAVSHAA